MAASFAVSDNTVHAVQWQEIEQLSQTMLAKARAGEWDALAGLEQQRRELLEEYFGKSPAIGMEQSVADSIHKLLAIDKAILELTHTMREEMHTQMQQLSTGRRAHHAYSENSFE